MVVGSSDLEIDRESSFICNRLHDEYDTGSVETNNLQSTDQTEPIASTNGSGETHLSIARSSKQTLAELETISTLKDDVLRLQDTNLIRRLSAGSVHSIPHPKLPSVDAL